MVTATPHQDVEDAYGRDPEEVAMLQVTGARMALSAAIEAFQAAGYGSHVTNPLREGLRLVEFSIKEVNDGAPCEHLWKVTHQGVTYCDCKCAKCGETKRETWD